MAWKIVENFNRLSTGSRVHEMNELQTDRRQTVGRTMTYTFTFAKHAFKLLRQ